MSQESFAKLESNIIILKFMAVKHTTWRNPELTAQPLKTKIATGSSK